jgi:hypothetical protein
LAASHKEPVAITNAGESIIEGNAQNGTRNLIILDYLAEHILVRARDKPTRYI